ncbi:hypothetical protein H9P43_006627 [Blastocladiella emersonii ATCC 22665]|nr:hypothetical protein H9P43_006627 [Blastocladiella emersonii ATCC 22665]
MKPVSILYLLALLAVLSRAQTVPFVVDDLSKTATNSLGYYHGGSGVTYAAGTATVSSTGYFGTSFSGDAGVCYDMTGKAVYFEYTPTSARQAVNVYFGQRDAKCASWAVNSAAVSIVGPATVARAAATIPMSQFGLADPKRADGVTFDGPIKIHLVKVIADPAVATTTTTTTAVTSTAPQPTSGVSTSVYPAPVANPLTFRPVASLAGGTFVKDEWGMYMSCGKPGAFAYTLDDGPSPLTPGILASLAKANMKATFFMVGANINSYRSIAQQVHAAGHQLAAHSQTHADLATLTATQVRSEVNGSNQAIKSIVGYTPRFFRPPYGSVNANVMSILHNEFKFRVIYWSLDSQDWQTATTEDGIVKYFDTELAKSPAKSNSHIALSHDIQQKTANVIDRTLPLLAKYGYVQVPLYQCLNEKGYNN